MNILLVKINKLTYEEKELELSDLFTDELYQFSDEIVGRYDSQLPIVNEVYLRYVQPVQAITLFLKKNKVKLIKLEKPDEGLLPILIDAAYLCGISVIGTPTLFKLKRKISGHINIMGSMMYMLWQMLIKSQSDEVMTQNLKVSIIRTPAAKKKMGFLKNLDVKYENLKDKRTLYSCFSRIKRVSWVIKAWVNSYYELNRYGAMINEFIGSFSSLDSFYYYSKRIIHTLVYGYMLEVYFYKNRGKTFYTGNNLDRFAILEEQIAKKYGVDIVCIPHGLEYGFKFPHCFIGNIFYTTSEQAAIHLNSLYNTSKFTYDCYIAKKMFSIKNSGKKDQDVVFFTEPREVDVNLRIIDELLQLFEKQNRTFSIKLHPKDHRSDYARYEGRVKFIEDFNEAVSNNICFSRKSTTLLEAVYNDSKAGAILINSKDKAIFNTFPSLRDEKIKVFYSNLDLFNWINSEYLD